MPENNLKRRLIQNSFWSFLNSTINKIGALIFTIILARFLMPENFGIFSIVLSVSMLLLTFADLGVNQALTRYLSHSLAKNKKELSAYYQYLLKIKLVLILVTSILLLVIAYPLAFYVFKNSALFIPLMVSAAYIFIAGFEGFYSTIFYSIEKVQYLSIRESVYQIFRIVFSLLIFFFVATTYQVTGLFISYILITIILLAFSLIYLKRLIPDIFLKSKTTNIDKKKIKTFVGFLTLASISGVFFSYADSIILGIFVSAEYVGYYRASFSLLLGITGLISSVNAILLPIFSKLEKQQLEMVFNKILRYFIILALPASFGLAILGRYFINLLYGHSYLPASNSLVVLSFLIFPILASGIFTALYSSRERSETPAKLMILLSIINVVLNFLFIIFLVKISPTLAITGAAIATLISWFIYTGVYINYIKRDFNIKFSFSLLIIPLVSSIIMSLIILYLKNMIMDISLFSGVALVILGMVIYFILIFLFKTLNRNDLYFVRDLLKFEFLKISKTK